MIGTKVTGARSKGGRRKRVWSQTHDAEEPLEDLTAGHLAEGRARYDLCNQILRAAASAEPNACESSLSIEVHKTSRLAPRSHRKQGVFCQARGKITRTTSQRRIQESTRFAGEALQGPVEIK